HASGDSPPPVGPTPATSRSRLSLSPQMMCSGLRVDRAQDGSLFCAFSGSPMIRKGVSEIPWGPPSMLTFRPGTGCCAAIGTAARPAATRDAPATRDGVQRRERQQRADVMATSGLTKLPRVGTEDPLVNVLIR